MVELALLLTRQLPNVPVWMDSLENDAKTARTELQFNSALKFQITIILICIYLLQIHARETLVLMKAYVFRFLRIFMNVFALPDFSAHFVKTVKTNDHIFALTSI